MCSCCMSHPNAVRLKRWNNVTRPPFQSEWCRLTPSMPALGENRRPTLGAFADPLQPRRVDELHVGVDRAEWDQVLVSRMAQPQPRNDVRSGLADELDHGASDRLILEIEGQLVVRAAALEQLGERGDVRRQLFAA